MYYRRRETTPSTIFLQDGYMQELHIHTAQNANYVLACTHLASPPIKVSKPPFSRPHVEASNLPFCCILCVYDVVSINNIKWNLHEPCGKRRTPALGDACMLYNQGRHSLDSIQVVGITDLGRKEEISSYKR